MKKLIGIVLTLVLALGMAGGVQAEIILYNQRASWEADVNVTHTETFDDFAGYHYLNDPIGSGIKSSGVSFDGQISVPVNAKNFSAFNDFQSDLGYTYPLTNYLGEGPFSAGPIRPISHGGWWAIGFDVTFDPLIPAEGYINILLSLANGENHYFQHPVTTSGYTFFGAITDHSEIGWAELSNFGAIPIPNPAILIDNFSHGVPYGNEVPEPSSIFLFGFGILCLAGIRRRKNITH